MENDRKLGSSDTQESEQWARTGGEWFLRLLQELGVKYVFGTTGYLPNVRLVGNSAMIISQLTSSIRKKVDPQFKKIARERGARNKLRHENMLSGWSKEAKKHIDENPVSAYRVAFEINKLWDENTIWVNQTITMKQPLLHAIKLTKPGTYFSSPSGHLGPVASMAYGVALARHNEKVVAMTGDGDFVFGNPASFLWTCSHYHIPVLYLVFNNACWGVD